MRSPLCLETFSRVPYFFFLNDPPTTEIYPLPLPDALPISRLRRTSARRLPPPRSSRARDPLSCRGRSQDRKSTRLNSSHSQISYAVFCLKKKKIIALISEAQSVLIYVHELYAGWYTALIL